MLNIEAATRKLMAMTAARVSGSAAGSLGRCSGWGGIARLLAVSYWAGRGSICC